VLLDGHLRLELALERGEDSLPVVVVDLTERQEQLALATLDPIGAQAEADPELLAALLEAAPPESPDLGALLSGVVEETGRFDVDEVPPPELKSGNRAPFQQMTFTLHDSQVAIVKRALESAKGNGGGTSEVNENSNGNALAHACQALLDG
jgi:ParB-like chromosome segregation protein Spo0J